MPQNFEFKTHRMLSLVFILWIAHEKTNLTCSLRKTPRLFAQVVL